MQAKLWHRLKKDVLLNKYLYIMLIPVVAFYLIFYYAPMGGLQIAFKDFSPGLGIWGSEWVGFKHFEDFFGNYYFFRLLGNTLAISVSSLVFGFPIPIIFAILVNELSNRHFRRVVQSVTYFPHFISVVVICGLLVDFCSDDGVVSQAISMVTGSPAGNVLQAKQNFVPTYVISGIWQSFGWNSIIYLAALTAIDSQLYEAAVIDGAGRFKQIWHVTLPGILPTVSIMLILAIGNIMNVGWEKIILLYSPATYETADVISSFVYRRGMVQADYSYATAVGLFNSIINFILVFSSNRISRKLTGNSLW